MKNVFIIMVLLAVLFAASGCQTAHGLFGDVAGTSAWVADKLQKPAEQAKARDADLAAKKLAERQAILDARARRVSSEVQ